MCGGEVLELVDEHEPASALGLVTDLSLGEEHLQAQVDLLVEVDGSASRELGSVAREHVGQALDVAAEVLLHGLWASQSQTNPREGVDP